MQRQFHAGLPVTMQTGFGMLEAGSVSAKNVSNIMARRLVSHIGEDYPILQQVKNIVDVSLGGFMYWALGFGLSFGPQGNGFIRLGSFFFEDQDAR